MGHMWLLPGIQTGEDPKRQQRISRKIPDRGMIDQFLKSQDRFRTRFAIDVADHIHPAELATLLVTVAIIAQPIEPFGATRATGLDRLHKDILVEPAIIRRLPIRPLPAIALEPPMTTVDDTDQGCHRQITAAAMLGKGQFLAQADAMAIDLWLQSVQLLHQAIFDLIATDIILNLANAPRLIIELRGIIDRLIRPILTHQGPLVGQLAPQ